MIDWDVYRTILAVAREGSLVKASRVLGVNNATAGRHLKQVETQLGTRLFDRTRSGLHPTEVGKIAIEAAIRIEREIEGTNRQLIGTDINMTGTVRLSVPLNLLPYFLSADLKAFVDKYPSIYLRVNADDSLMEFDSREVDVFIRASNTPPDGLWGYKLAELGFRFYATESFLERWQREMEEAPTRVPLPYVALNDTAPARDRDQLLRVYPNARAVADVNVIDSVLAMVRQGMGAGRLGRYIGDSFPDLRSILECDATTNRTLWILTHPDLRRTRRIQTIMEFIRDRFVERRGSF